VKDTEPKKHTAEEPEAHGEAVLRLGGNAHPGMTPEEVLPIDRSYIQWAASLSSDPAIRARCKELLAASKP
jgi:hypothetical protein